MTVLVLGSGGREHALALACHRDPEVAAVHVAPGNPGTASFATNHPLDPCDCDAVVSLARGLEADLVVVGPEAPLVAGVADALRESGIDCFGPSAEAAQLEGSKAFAKEVMAAARVPTAASRSCDDANSVSAALDEFGPPYVVKDDGLAGGKGVVVTHDRAEALAHAKRCFESDHRVVVEEYLDGPEVSLFAICDGTRALPMQPAQDFKRVGNGGVGPNTGGMGAYSPVPQIPQSVVDEAIEKIVRPTVEGMAEEGTPFTGILYAGLIATADGPKVIEFNARFGDPETEVVLPKLTSDLGAGISAILDGETPEFTWDESNATLGVVIASNGYPENVIKGARVPEIEVDEDSHVYYAGVASDEHGNLVANSGRVLLVETSAPDIKSAQDKVYAIIDKLELRGLFYRHDIGFKALK